jgi:hypothetical protein
MNCQDFQKYLPEMIETGGGSEEHEQHLRSCQVCSDLVADLKYIAEQARLLLPMQDPDPRVWSEIQTSLEREGLIKEGRRSLQGLDPGTPQSSRSNKKSAGTILGVIVLAGIGLFLVNSRRPVPVAEAQPAAPVALIDADDRQVLAALPHDPALRQTYTQSLHDANSYIREAQRALEADPDDADARNHLMAAYEQKVMLYELARATSFQ